MCLRILAERFLPYRNEVSYTTKDRPRHPIGRPGGPAFHFPVSTLSESKASNVDILIFSVHISDSQGLRLPG